MTTISTFSSSSIPEIYSPSLLQSYPDTLRFLQSLNKKLKADGVLAPTASSIDHVRTLYSALGRPLDDIPVVHVGGTNGKGSVCYKIASALTAKGYKTGLFVSPHLMSYRERAQVDHQLISKEDVLRHLTSLVQLCASNSLAATEFELSFLLAALHFQAQKCEVVVLEVGCGGRYDATNVVNNALAILTSVALDHTAILGNTVEEIAKVKAGIFREGKPALVGPGVPFEIVKGEATKCGAVLYQLPTSLSSKGVVMEPDEINYMLSLEAIRLLRKILPPRSNCSNEANGPEEEQVLAALRQLPPCRWQQIRYQHPSYDVEIEVILDVAHNPAALEALLHRLDSYLQADIGGPADSKTIASNGKGDESHCKDYEAIVHVVYAASRTKDMRSCLHLLADHLPLSSIHLTQVDPSLTHLLFSMS